MQEAFLAGIPNFRRGMPSNIDFGQGEKIRQHYELSRAGHAEIYQRIAGEPVETTVSRIMDQQYRQKEVEEEQERQRRLVEEVQSYEDEDSNMTDVD
jgi:hypothetical protein